MELGQPGIAMNRVVLALFLIVAMWVPQVDAKIPSLYDPLICQAAERWLVVWQPDACSWLKAQVYQESRMRPDAVSPVGAQGLMQIMPGTWKDHAMAVSRMIGADLQTPFDPRASLQVGAYYLKRCRDAWIWDRPEWARRELGFACYNAGLGHILNAQKRCGNAKFWSDIEVCLPQVTGRHAAETMGYVRHIKKWQQMIKSGL